MHTPLDRRGLGLATAVTLAVGMAMTASAAAAPPAASAAVANDTLTIVGTNGADQLALRLVAGDPTRLQVDFGDDGSAEQTVSRATFSKIDVLLLSGDDHFRIDQGNGAFADETLTVDAGNGDDTVLGGDGNEVVVGGNGDDLVDGNRGADRASLENGADTFVWDGGDGSDVVVGGHGSDTLVFNGASGDETMRLSPNGTAAVFLRSPGSVRMDMVDVEVLRVQALDGADSIAIDDMRGTTLRTAELDLGSQGAADQKADVVTVNGTEDADTLAVQTDGAQVDVTGSTPAVEVSGAGVGDRLQLNTLGGDDTVTVGDDVAARIAVAVDLGTGEV